MTKEKLIKEIMAEAEKDGEPVTYEEAEEMAEMEMKSGDINRRETKEDKKPRKPKERKVDNTKLDLLTPIKDLLEELEATSLELKTETEIAFNYKGDDYSLKLIRHRGKKDPITKKGGK
jgi:hypothetical protein